MLHVIIPSQCSAERSYIVDTLLTTFLGISYTASFSPQPHYTIKLPNGKSITIADHFWNKYGDNYLNANNIPDKISFLQNQYTGQQQVAVLFGLPEIRATNDGFDCEIDLFASSFFMLTRWEETVQPQCCDSLGRFLSHHALAVKHNFIHLPIVNCYALIIKKMLYELGYVHQNNDSFRCQLTVDVDDAQRWPTLLAFARSLIGSSIRQHSLRNIVADVKKYYSQSDDYNTFNYINELSSKHNIPIRWYILPNEQNMLFLKKNRALFQSAIQQQTIGFHPSIEAANNSTIFAAEKMVLEDYLLCNIVHNRFHYLAGQIPQCWHLLEENGFKTDSSLYYTKHPGFRTGSCTPYQMFSVRLRRPLQLTQEPLLVMDASIFHHTDSNKIIEQFFQIKQQTRFHNGLFTFLWHNSSFANEWAAYRFVLEKLLSDDV